MGLLDSLLQETATMAARISASVVDFAALAAKIPAEQKVAFGAHQNKVHGHLRKVNSLPATAPAIDFDAYKSKITVPGMVDNFAAKYAALSIPYPGDQGTLAAIDFWPHRETWDQY